MPYADPIKRKECLKRSIAKWEANNRERILKWRREWRKKWRDDNPEKNKQIKLKSYLKHRESNLERQRRNHQRSMQDPARRAEMQEQRRLWKIANPQKVRAANRRMQVLRRSLVGEFTSAQWMARVSFYGWRCAYCLCSLKHDTLTVDHIIPVTRGGTNWASNLAPACFSCNRKKNRKLILPHWLRKES